MCIFIQMNVWQTEAVCIKCYGQWNTQCVTLWTNIWVFFILLFIANTKANVTAVDGLRGVICVLRWERERNHNLLPQTCTFSIILPRWQQTNSTLTWEHTNTSFQTSRTSFFIHQHRMTSSGYCTRTSAWCTVGLRKAVFICISVQRCRKVETKSKKSSAKALLGMLNNLLRQIRH